MNCGRIEKLIPLCVEGDLEPGQASAVELHLKSCSRCCQLAEEYKDSQSWLRSYRVPRPEGEFFDELKSAVLKDIRRVDSRISVLQLVTPGWRRTRVLPAVVALAVISSSVAYYIHMRKPRTISNSLDTISIGPPSIEPAVVVKGKEVSINHRSHSVPTRSHRRRTPPKIQLEAEQIATQPMVLPAGRVSSGAEGSASAAGEEEGEHLLRIELQTSDPSIRIIWFSPKVHESDSSKPTTATN